MKNLNIKTNNIQKHRLGILCLTVITIYGVNEYKENKNEIVDITPLDNNYSSSNIIYSNINNTDLEYLKNNQNYITDVYYEFNWNTGETLYYSFSAPIFVDNNITDMYKTYIVSEETAKYLNLDTIIENQNNIKKELN